MHPIAWTAKVIIGRLLRKYKWLFVYGIDCKSPTSITVLFLKHVTRWDKYISLLVDCAKIYC